jgi:uncharacterized protein (DUF1778 family)
MGNKRRKRAIPGKSEEGRRVMVYLYQDEYDKIYRASVKAGSSISGYMTTSALERATRELK